jgi:molecular chaperone DnaK
VAKVLGIDLGTTNCCVAVVEVGSPQVIPNREGARTTPSIVGFTEDGERLVGQIAKRQAITNPTQTIYAVKRLIGRKWESPEVKQAKDHLSYALVPAPNGDLKIRVRERDYAPEEISAFILREIKEFCEESLGEEIKEAIITVPAYFDDSQRQATRDSGRIAGLEVLRIINEPTAASLAYGLEKQKKQETIAVYDLGGGTFDISILRIDNGMFEVLSTSGDTFLGGEDFDRVVMDWLLADFLNTTGIDLRQDRLALQRLKEAAEKAKCELSTALETMVALPFIASDASGPKHINKLLTRDTFEALVDHLVKRTEGPCKNALEAAGLKPEQIDTVILVGGQTRTPKVQQMVESIFAKPPNRSINPDEVVAVGAAIQAGVLRGEIKDLVLLDVTPLSLGLETHGGIFVKLIERNSTIPTKNTQIFTTVTDNQTTVEIHVLQGERGIAKENKSLGKFQLVGIPAAAKGVPQIEVTFAIDSSGIVNVSARDLATGKAQGLQISPAGGLSQEEIDRIIEEAAANKTADAKRKEIRQLKNKLEGLIASNERVFREFGNLLQEDERDRVARTLENAREVMTGDERGPIDDAMIDMKGVSRILTQAMLYKPDKGKGKDTEEKESAKPA